MDIMTAITEIIFPYYKSNPYLINLISIKSKPSN